MNNKVKFLLTALVFSLVTGAAFAEYTCEVMALHGKASLVSKGENTPRELKEGDLIKEGDKIKVEEGTADLAFDKDWNNVTRLAQGTEVQIRSIYPTGLVMERGDIFARLEKLPKNSTFEIQTPTCVAAVRGSAYRTIHEAGESRVLNYASSPVEVFGLDNEGKLLDDPVVLRGEEKTEVKGVGEPPVSPEKMTEAEIKEAGQFQSDVKDEVRELDEEGREGKVQAIETIDKEYAKELDKRVPEQAAGAETQISAESSPKEDFDREPSQVVDRVEEALVKQTDTSLTRKQDQSNNASVGDGGVKGGSGDGSGDRDTNLKNV